MAAGYSDFQLKEYENISQAHFKINEMITAFFRYYILIMTVPVTAFGAVITFSGGKKILDALPYWQIPISFALVGFGVLGFLIMLFIGGLKTKAVLYARQVNAIRGYFRNLALMSDDSPSAGWSVLPGDHCKPSMTGFKDYWYIVFSFAVLNSLYLISAYWIGSLDVKSLLSTEHPTDYLGGGLSTFSFTSIAVTLFVIHLVANYIVSKLNETRLAKYTLAPNEV